MSNFYISDMHFGHYNIMKHSKRNFKSTDEMDELFIKNWNNVVTDNDDVWILGDFSYKSANNPLYYLDRLNGKKHLIVGNHDRFMLKQPACRKKFESIDDYKVIEDEGQKIVLFHYPIVEWDGYFRGALHFFGHIHNNVDNDAYMITEDIKGCYNVGTDIIGFTPRKKDEIIKLNEEYWKKQREVNIMKQDIECDIKALREKTGLNRADFAKHFNIPYRTVEDWEARKSNCAPYLFKLMEKDLVREGFIKK